VFQEFAASRKTSAVETSQAVKAVDSTLQAVMADETKPLEKVQALEETTGQTAKAEVRKTMKITTAVSSKQPHLEGVGSILQFSFHFFQGHYVII
jgi:hypothetical protein